MERGEYYNLALIAGLMFLLIGFFNIGAKASHTRWSKYHNDYTRLYCVCMNESFTEDEYPTMEEEVLVSILDKQK